MDKTSLLLSGLITIGFALLIAPSVFRMNRGRVLQNVALWLIIFLGLGLAYRTFGPGHSEEPILSPASVQTEKTADPAEPKAENDQGYFPPKED